MEVQFQANNTHLVDVAAFNQTDPNLRRLYQQKYIYRSSLIDQFPRDEACILTLGGGRQVGKSTLLKQWMEDLLLHGVPPQAVCFFSGELINDHHNLYRIMLEQISNMPAQGMKYFILDEVTDIKQWDHAIKYAADTGLLEQVVLVLSGSDLVLMQEARKRFPGRRGRADKVDFHYYPLSFREFVQLTDRLPQNLAVVTEQELKQLYQAFDEYLIHGGFLKAINDVAFSGRISKSTLATYSDWIRGDMLRHNKNEVFLREIIAAILKHYTKLVSWDNLVKELSIDHTKTVADYIVLLSSMDAVFVQPAIIENKLQAAPKKRKKLMFCDPFIYHAMSDWLNPTEDPYEQQIKPIFSQPEQYANLVEACVSTHFRRFFPTYYIKSEGEVDVAYVRQGRFWPIEVKWTNQLRPKDLKQVAKYNNAEIYAKTMRDTVINGVPTRPLPLALLHIDAMPGAVG